MKLCDKSGNGVCTNCSKEYMLTVYCRHDVAFYADYLEEQIEDMINFMYRHCERFDTQKEVVEFFDFKFRDGREVV